MTRPRGILAYPVSVIAVLVCAVLLIFALWRLLDQEAELRGTAADNMLWTISQAQVAAYRLDAALGRARQDDVDDETLRLRYDVLLSRMELLEGGPQQRYLDDMEEGGALRALAKDIRTHEAAFVTGEPTSQDNLHALLEDYAEATGRAANKAMVAQLETFGSLLDRQHGAILHVIAAALAVSGLGALISWRMLAALRAEHRAQMSLLREREMREAYRGFVAMVSHQFQSPLAAIDASMQRILRASGGMPTAEVVDRASRVRETVLNLSDLVRATRESVRLDAGQIEMHAVPCDIAAELHAARRVQNDAHPDRTIRVEIDNSVPARFCTDSVLLQQILGNLLANAIAYSPKPEPVIMHAKASSDILHIAITDRGIGIPLKERPMLFEPFFRASTAAKTQGLGMGLHLSRRLAHLLGGDLTYDSRPDRGSTFVLGLPL